VGTQLPGAQVYDTVADAEHGRVLVELGVLDLQDAAS
jgi:hypothetical protein